MAVRSAICAGGPLPPAQFRCFILYVEADRRYKMIITQFSDSFLCRTFFTTTTTDVNHAAWRVHSMSVICLHNTEYFSLFTTLLQLTYQRRPLVKRYHKYIECGNMGCRELPSIGNTSLRIISIFQNSDAGGSRPFGFHTAEPSSPTHGTSAVCGLWYGKSRQWNAGRTEYGKARCCCC
jgi:hypothetical protein